LRQICAYRLAADLSHGRRVESCRFFLVEVAAAALVDMTAQHLKEIHRLGSEFLLKHDINVAPYAKILSNNLARGC
jgi:hypothetical protein